MIAYKNISPHTPRELSQDRLMKDLANSGVEGYYKKLGERYRQKFLELQKKHIELQEQVQQERTYTEQSINNKCSNIVRDTQIEVKEMQMRNQALEDQIYQHKHKLEVLQHDFKRQQDENEMLKKQIEQVKESTEETIK